uniref:Uncharacterized protein n=1 Tax=Zea mays TaxID=4577 RepID=C0PAP5_MAIZE|nr:unknown [Zea mays]
MGTAPALLHKLHVLGDSPTALAHAVTVVLIHDLMVTIIHCARFRNMSCELVYRNQNMQSVSLSDAGTERPSQWK